jgi:dCTP deaminase
MMARMSIKPDWWIRAHALEGMIEPFADRLVRQTEAGAGIISYGLSSFGYDLRAAREWKIFVNAFNTVVDPKNFDPASLIEFEGDECIIPPNSFVLARSVEYMRIPDNVMVVALGKSSYARCGIVANVTPLEPGWEGHVTLEFSNTTPLPAKMYANEGCVQLLFFEGEKPETTYADRKGKYQGQRGVTLPRL